MRIYICAPIPIYGRNICFELITSVHSIFFSVPFPFMFSMFLQFTLELLLLNHANKRSNLYRIMCAAARRSNETIYMNTYRTVCVLCVQCIISLNAPQKQLRRQNEYTLLNKLINYNNNNRETIATYPICFNCIFPSN